jgi:hypothetical protein
LSAEEEESDCDGKGDEGGRVAHYVEDEVVCVAWWVQYSSVGGWDGGLPKGMTTMNAKVNRNIKNKEAVGAPHGQLLAQKRENGSMPSFASSWSTRASLKETVITFPKAERDTNAAAILLASSPNIFPMNNAATVTPLFPISAGVATEK